ncbi:hypothetical protein HPB50_027212 [Hyalomma asiaticum]|uniref:Uncharacterized protein n=1 Tax=Hyalomma asiaticum TaxID=266040 RepID=A0ACB7SHM7_HYAAI|nr:hypothetical protein HPB50_027212 [Hyalomma asiaticum]
MKSPFSAAAGRYVGAAAVMSDCWTVAGAAGAAEVSGNGAGGAGTRLRFWVFLDFFPDFAAGGASRRKSAARRGSLGAIGLGEGHLGAGSAGPGSSAGTPPSRQQPRWRGSREARCHSPKKSPHDDWGSRQVRARKEGSGANPRCRRLPGGPPQQGRPQTQLSSLAGKVRRRRRSRRRSNVSGRSTRPCRPPPPLTWAAARRTPANPGTLPREQSWHPKVVKGCLRGTGGCLGSDRARLGLDRSC